MSEFYQVESSKVIEEIVSNVDQGLTHNEAAERLEHYGFNELVETGKKSPWRILWEQMTSIKPPGMGSAYKDSAVSTTSRGPIMPIETLKNFLDDNKVKYVTIRHSIAYTAQQIAESAHVSGHEIAKVVIVELDGEPATEA